MCIVLTIVLVYICGYAESNMCQFNVPSKDITDSKKALTALETYFGTTVNTLERNVQNSINTLKANLQTLKRNVGTKIKAVDTDLKVLQRDFQKNKWKKYGGHCYYFSRVNRDWFTAELACRQSGGYIVKIDNMSENSWIAQNRPSRGSTWIGLTDLKEGDWRWSFDQSRPSYTPKWVSGYGSKGTSVNCVVINGGQTLWHDYYCDRALPYVCESNYCF
ncbi:perlucin-like protein [Mytilus galloprovincialis]|uniref:perlucin-like protein n=1 Tax=Mytilus galloprovincialis TaxID=29158 RepID=UPI003F7B8857